MIHLIVFHNLDSRFQQYDVGHRLVAVASHWLEPDIAATPAQVADWAFATFNADLDVLASGRANPGGETAFLAATLYRLHGHRSLSVGDVIAVHSGGECAWLACDPVRWRPITEPIQRCDVAPPTGETRTVNPADQPTATAAEQAFATLTPGQRISLLRGVFQILEYDEDGRPGGEWSSDTTQALGDLFATNGIAFTSPA